MKLRIVGKASDPWSQALLEEVPGETNKRTILLADTKSQLLLTIPARIAGFRVLWLGSNDEQSAVAKTLISSMSRFVHSILVPNQAAEAQNLKLGIPSRKISLIYPPATLTKPRECKGDEFVVACDGAIDIEHGLGTILQGVSLAQDILGNIKLVIGGSVQEKNRIEWLAKELNLQDAIQIIPSRGFSWIEPCRLFLLIQHSNDPVPLSIAHALSHGKPIVASDQLSHHEFIQHEKNGILLANPNQDMLSQALINLCRKPDWLTKLAYGSAAFAQGRFDKNIVEKKMNRVRFYRILTLPHPLF